MSLHWAFLALLWLAGFGVWLVRDAVGVRFGWDTLGASVVVAGLTGGMFISAVFG